ncbi:MAG: serine/threonine protein kinase, partial [Acidobacteria bacterium]|nr:serine/threonine protein kinase [Acidobacteriota bacterium]
MATVLDGGYFASSEAPYVQVTAIDFDLNDNLMLVDTYGRAIRKLDEGGVLTLLAGGVRSAIDGELAREALLNQPVDIEVDRDGSVIVVDQLDHKIRRISLEGIINTVAGTGECGWTGDGGPALEARLCWPSRVTIDTQGNIIFVDGSTRIRRIGTDGVISTIAGGDERSYSGDGGPATEARFGGITDVVADSNGNIYVG